MESLGAVSLPSLCQAMEDPYYAQVRVFNKKWS